MSWDLRLRTPRYISPSGKVFEFEYQDVERARDKKVGAFDFPRLNGSYFQDLGNKGSAYVMRISFSGENHDEIADQFFDATGERGPATLEHPRYGTLIVLPLSVKQTDALTTKANTTTFVVDCRETLEGSYPKSNTDAISEIDNSMDELSIVGADKYEQKHKIPDGAAASIDKQETGSLLDSIENSLNGLMEDSANFAASIDEVRANIDELISKPATMVNQLSEIISMPARAIGNTVDMVTGGYINLVQTVNSATDMERISNLVTGSLDNHRVLDTSTASANINSSQRNYTLSLSAITALARSIVMFASNGSLTTRAQAILLCENLSDLWEETQQRYDRIQSNFVGLGQLEYQWSQDDELNRLAGIAVASAVGNITDLSFGLYTERVLVLVEPSNIISLSAKLYGSVDNCVVQKLIDTNSLKGEEILFVPAGKEIVYYA